MAGGTLVDAFRVHEQLIQDYRSFTEGFVEIQDQRIRQHVEQQAAQGAQWPPPWLALNPAFASGGRIDELVADGLLHPECERIFRPKRTVEDTGEARSHCIDTSVTPSRWPEPAPRTC